MDKNKDLAGIKVVHLCGMSDRGLVRRLNEDGFAIAGLQRERPYIQSLGRETPITAEGLIILVTDGMGGAPEGERASQLAIMAIVRYMTSLPGHELDQSEDMIFQMLEEALQIGNEEIRHYTQSEKSTAGMGCTATLAFLTNNRLFLAQIGDSRAYLVRGLEVIQLTDDQTLANDLVMRGKITTAQAEVSRYRHVLLQALGPSKKIAPQLICMKVFPNDTLIVNSDGLTNYLTKEDILLLSEQSLMPSDFCLELIGMANRRGGADNITAVVARIEAV